MSTHIYVIPSSNDTNSVVKKLNSVFNVKQLENNNSVTSPNKNISCHLSASEREMIDFYLSNNLHIKFNDLKSYMRLKFPKVDNVILSSYIRSKGYAPITIKAYDGSSTKVWIK